VYLVLKVLTITFIIWYIGDGIQNMGCKVYNLIYEIQMWLSLVQKLWLYHCFYLMFEDFILYKIIFYLEDIQFTFLLEMLTWEGLSYNSKEITVEKK